MCARREVRRAWVRGQTNVSKVHTLKCAACNLGLLLRKVWGYCKPRNTEAAAVALFFAVLALLAVVAAITDRTMERTLTWMLDGCGLLLVSVAANLCIRFIRGTLKNGYSLTRILHSSDRK